MIEKKSFALGDVVEIISGPFRKAVGKVMDINNSKQMLVVVVKDGLRGIVVGDLPVELKFQEVRKIAS
jgi:transcription antitermination factor NusG